MSGIHPLLDRAGYRPLAEALGQCSSGRFTGVLQVIGQPGGTVHLREGLVLSVDSPGAPGPATLLLRSGRMDENEWSELAASVGTAQLHVIRLMATHDAVFAMAAGQVAQFQTHIGYPPPPGIAEPGEEPERLLREAWRRLSALAALPVLVLPDRDRFVPGVRPTDPGPARR